MPGRSALAALAAAAAAAASLGAWPTPPPSLAVVAQEAASRRALESRLSDCFSLAYATADSSSLGCASLGALGTRRLALALSACHLEVSGRSVPPPCAAESPLDACARALPAEAFASYSAYALHAENLCFFLEAGAWRADVPHGACRSIPRSPRRASRSRSHHSSGASLAQ